MSHEYADEPTQQSLSLTRCRELLGDDADGLSDQDVERVRDHADTMAHVVIALFLQQQRHSEE
jgi:hypothetical protein